MASKFQEYVSQSVSVEGFFMEQAAITWDCLLNYQTNHNIKGNFLEIGVWKGKSAILSCLHANPEETCLLVDLIMFDEAQELLRNLHSNSNFYRCKSQNFWQNEANLHQFFSSCRWIHIDGAHSGSACFNDLQIANQLLSEEGIICMDDFFNPSYPQVTAAVFNFLYQFPFSLKLFLCGFNKGYLARPYYCDNYLRYLLENFHNDLSLINYSEKITLYKTSRPGDFNCFGLREYQGKDFVGLDEDGSKILI